MLKDEAVAELVKKIKLYGCNVADVETDEITADSVDKWAEQTYTYMEDFADDSFTLAELFAVQQLAEEIAEELAVP